MPTYQYACRSCGHRFEVVQSMSEEPLTTCPECGGELRKVYAPPAIAFRGSGFYATDHGKRAGKEEGGGTATKEKEGAAAKGSGTSSEAEKRSDAGSEPKGGSGPSKPAPGGTAKKQETG